MSSWIRQSTSVDVGIGPFVDSVDGVTAKTALSLTQPDVRLKKNNGNWAQKAAAQTLAHEENGWYEVTLDATDTNTLGILIVNISKATALPVWKEYLVVPANVYDSLISGVEWLSVFGGAPLFSISGNTLTIKKQDGTTNQTTRTITSTPGASPITGLA